MELDPKLLISHARKAGGIAIIGMGVPFALGVAISGTMFNVLQGSDPKYEKVSFTSFAVFIGTALSITAFPVLARILKEGGLIYTRPGSMAMGAAALNDALAWILLILAISIANSGNMTNAAWVFLTTVAFALFLFIAVRPPLEWLVLYVEESRNPKLKSQLFAFIFIMIFLCAWFTGII